MFFHRNDNDDQNPDGNAQPGDAYPLLPLRDIIVFPHMVVPLFVGREKSINALEEAMSQDKEILLAAQKKAKTNDPTAGDIFEVGTIGTIIQLLRLPDGTVKVSCNNVDCGGECDMLIVVNPTGGFSITRACREPVDPSQ